MLIDRQLTDAGWSVHDSRSLNPFAAQGIARREATMATGHGRADYLLYVDQRVVGVIEAKPEGTPLSGVEWQSAMYADGLPADVRLAAQTKDGPAKAARAYVERDRSRADDYYLGESTGVAERLTATPAGVTGAGSMDGETYEQWVAGIDIDTGLKKGRVREDANALRFVEVTVNGPKSWSLAAALHPEISAALDVAQDEAAAEIVGWVAQHATTRVGPRGRQVQVPVEKTEAAVIRHYMSRAGDPHRHLHLQINARVWQPAPGRACTRWVCAT